MPLCASIAENPEHTAEDILVKFHTTYLPELSEGQLGAG